MTTPPKKPPTFGDTTPEERRLRQAECDHPETKLLKTFGKTRRKCTECGFLFEVEEGPR